MAIKVKRRRSARDATIDQLRSIAESEAAANIVMAKVQQEAELIAQRMEKIHGGVWSVAINHRSCFVLIARDGD
ncbi:hypothetical protein [Mesorhizobium sp. Pch-S]|uniref:hypothetical protein n=1 Tax=Mesorhizobium sp. Pch-S TaxID=2082387 RepID=UPI001012168C|nr:hypothetical protein [Mesorhizobium sp. Pch-S]